MLLDNRATRSSLRGPSGKGHRAWSLRGEATGQAATEFMIVLPVILLFICSILQLALIFVARSAVDYSAFCAARTAIVWYHEHEDGKDRRGRDAALTMAHRSASIANIVISGRPPSSHRGEFDTDDPVVTYLKAVSFMGMDTESWAERYKMSRGATDVSFVQGGGVEPGEPLTVRVVCWYRLYLPLVNRLLGYTVSTTQSSSTDGIRFVKMSKGTESDSGGGGLPGYYLPITASCTLDVE